MDKNAFTQIISDNEGIINKVISFYADRNYSPDDLYQEIVLNLWKSWAGFRGDSKVSTWIYRVALNTCLTYYRKKNRSPGSVEIRSEIPDIDRSGELKELYRLIFRLSKMDRALILLWLDDKTYKEIAEIMGLTVSNVATRLSRVKEELKTMSES